MHPLQERCIFLYCNLPIVVGRNWRVIGRIQGVPMQTFLNSAHFLAWEEPGYAHVRFAHVCTAREVPCQKMRRIQKCLHGDTLGTPDNPPIPTHNNRNQNVDKPGRLVALLHEGARFCHWAVLGRQQGIQLRNHMGFCRFLGRLPPKQPQSHSKTTPKHP